MAKELGVSLSRVTVLRQRPEFPDPIGEIAHGPIWDLDVVREWNQSGLRRSGSGRPSAAEARRTLGGRFVIEDETIGHGGFADVYRAVDKKNGAMVAIKILRNVEGVEHEAIKRFQRELRIMERLSHANVVRVLAQGETSDGKIWYAMPLAQGSLSDYVALLKGNPALIVDIMRQVCTGLAYIHSEGIYHRDLKPANVLRLGTSDDEADSWAVSDFGLAVMVERDTDPLTSTYRQGMGSWIYTAPEQWRNARSANDLSDIYGLGKILQELVTGEWPVNAEIPPGIFRPVIERAISDSPSSRYQSVAEFIDALDRAVGARQDHEAWETREEQAERLRDRLLGRPSAEDLVEVLDWAQSLSEREKDDMAALVRVLPWMSVSSINYLWERDSQALFRIVERFCSYVATEIFSFEYCDTLANFMQRIVLKTGSPAALGKVVAALARLGAHHDRWHVRDILVGILQKVRTQDEAVEVVEALRSIPILEARWSVTDFTLRTLPVSIRAGLGEILAKAS
ncbi:serine/threonine-protein kinase [Actinokineospora spheciospongiae]|uniref:serine/threonine-protein kinase n=1 Tax=Actinokineospora spheciospongiae TaxID=909613 RepID=UPI001C63D6AE|nr:serine/threonine-protein kinase [Actinokineospora spheciospongiae]